MAQPKKCSLVTKTLLLVRGLGLVTRQRLPCMYMYLCTRAGNVNTGGGGGTNVSEEPQSYSAWHFLTIFLVIAAVAVTSYVCVHNRKKVSKQLTLVPRVSSRAINLREINSHVVNAFRINLSCDQL